MFFIVFLCLFLSYFLFNLFIVVFKFRADVVSVRISNNLLTLAPKQAATVLRKPVKGLTTDRPQDPLPPIPPFFLDPRVPSGVEGLRVRLWQHGYNGEEHVEGVPETSTMARASFQLRRESTVLCVD